VSLLAHEDTHYLDARRVTAWAVAGCVALGLLGGGLYALLTRPTGYAVRLTVQAPAYAPTQQYGGVPEVGVRSLILLLVAAVSAYALKFLPASQPTPSNRTWLWPFAIPVVGTGLATGAWPIPQTFDSWSFRLVLGLVLAGLMTYAVLKFVVPSRRWVWGLAGGVVLLGLVCVLTVRRACSVPAPPPPGTGPYSLQVVPEAPTCIHANEQVPLSITVALAQAPAGLDALPLDEHREYLVATRLQPGAMDVSSDLLKPREDLLKAGVPVKWLWIIAPKLDRLGNQKIAFDTEVYDPERKVKFGTRSVLATIEVVNAFGLPNWFVIIAVTLGGVLGVIVGADVTNRLKERREAARAGAQGAPPAQGGMSPGPQPIPPRQHPAPKPPPAPKASQKAHKK
jgi:hypothetical protein